MKTIAELEKDIRALAGTDFASWGEGDNGDRYTELGELMEELLCTEAGEPAVKNIDYLRRFGWRIDVTPAEDKDFGPYWYGTLYVWGPYNIVWKWMGDSRGE